MDSKNSLKTYFKNINYLNEELYICKNQINYLNKKINDITNQPVYRCYHLTKTVMKHPYRFIKNLLPINFRKIITSHLSRLIIFNQKSKINFALKQEWKKFIKHQPKNIKADILVFGLISWNFRFQRPQQLSTELAKIGHRVFFIEHEFIPQHLSRSGFQAIEANKLSDNLYQIKISSGSNHFIYRDTPTQKDIEIMFGSIKTLLYKAKIVNPVAIIEHPFWSKLAEKLAMPIIYDCMDNHAGFSETSDKIIKEEKKLVQISKNSIATSNFLLSYLKKLKSSSLLITNGTDYNHFSRKTTIPVEMKSIKKPIIGYYGALSNWFDTVLLEKIAINFSHHSIVLIGEVTNSKITKLSKKYPNIILLGEKPYSQIPSYLSNFDVALIPFKINPLIKATNPVKIYEYFSQGKPVVTTALPELEKYNKILYFSKDHDAFLKNISEALVERQDNIKERILMAKSNQWSDKAKQISKLISSYFPKVSIVILVYNGTQMSKDSIDTVLKRSFYPNFELIVVDNASQPDTVKMLKKYQTHPQVKLILNKENFGFAKGNNIGTRVATGDFIVLLNNDILATPGWIERLVFHAQKSKVGLVGPVTNSIGNEAKINIEYDYTNQTEMENMSKKYNTLHWGDTLDLKNLAAFCWICPKDVYAKIGELDERFGRGMFEDDDYCHRVKKAGYQILCTEDAFIHHFGGASFKKIVSQEYLDLFESNKKKFENKWGIKWQPHQYRK